MKIRGVKYDQSTIQCWYINTLLLLRDLCTREKIQLIIHTKMCKACAKYQNHSEGLHKALENNNKQSKKN